MSPRAWLAALAVVAAWAGQGTPFWPLFAVA
jgi:hypothetical protein